MPETTAPVDAATFEGVHQWALEAARAAAQGLGCDTVVLDVGDILAVTDLFVITSGANRRQVRAIVDDVEQMVAVAGGPRPIRVEGAERSEMVGGHLWILLDYGGFVVHVFDDDSRSHYGLERLWSDRPKVEFAEG
ncbi:MAG: ribosome silencing factor [Actinobacteria bacterium]|nr:ribosome silencing factor [Actinomycetota bacterium]